MALTSHPGKPAGGIYSSAAALLLALTVASCSGSGPDEPTLQKGTALYRQGKYEAARDHFRKVHEENPDQRELAWQYLIKTRRAMQRGTLEESPVAQKPDQPQKDFVCQPEKNATENVEKTISATFIEMDLREALLELSALSGVSIVPDQTVGGLVSASIQALPLESALTMILAPNNFAFRKIDNFYLVGEGSPDNPSFHLLSETCLYKPVHLNPKEIFALVSPYYQPFLTLHEGRGLLTVVAPASIQQRIQRDVLTIDREPPQVLLEMTILEVTSKGREFLGIDWSREKSLTAEGVATGSSSLLLGGAGTIGLNFTKTTSLLTKTFQASVQWLSQSGDATLKANPSIVTLDGHEARFSSIHETWVDPTPASLRKQKEKIRYGVSLRIVPHISRKNEVVLEIISAEVSDLTTNDLGNPEVIAHSISSTVRMAEGEALVLGGLLQSKKQHLVTKVPFLGDIPILGYFFKSESDSIRETEVLIIIKPRILGGKAFALRETAIQGPGVLPPLEQPSPSESPPS